MHVGTEKQLFIDDAIVDVAHRTTRTWHQFKPHPLNPLMVPDQPWELANFLYGTVLRDPEDGSFRMWYTNGGARDEGGYFEERQLVCYATSSDGLSWERPSVGIFEIGGSKDNNVVAFNHSGGRHRGGSVVLDPKAVDPDRRYIHLHQTPNGHVPSYSPDGLHWATPDPPINRGSDAAMLLYDHRQERFFCSSVSMPEIRGFRRRAIEMSDTDLKTWHDFLTVLVPDEADDAGSEERIERLRSVLDFDNPDHHHAQLHHMVAFPYASLTLGILTLWDNTWYTDLEPLYALGRDRALIHLQLAWSRDQDWLEWHRPHERVPLVKLSDPGEWDCASQVPLHAPVVVGDELWLYYSGFSTVFNGARTHGWSVTTDGRVPPNGIGLATMRLDGFASLDAGPRGGTVTTKPFTFEGAQLTVNANALGHLAVEVLDEGGQPIEGYGHRSSTGDSLRHIPSYDADRQVRRTNPWPDLGRLAGRPIRLRFHLWNTELYGFAFES